MHREPIDFVILWVDGDDPAWRAEFLRHAAKPGDRREIRYRDPGTLRYFFRGVEAFAPWVRRVHFVTWGHVPSWLNTAHEKLRVVRHTDYMPPEFLPAFSSHPLELNLHRINGLSEQFVYFNDDMFLLRRAKPTDFFRNGLPRDAAALCPAVPRNWPPFLPPTMNALVVSRNFAKRKTILAHPHKWFNPRYGSLTLKTLALLPFGGFPGLSWFHLPTAFLKRTFDEVWGAEPEILHETCGHAFRQPTDVNQWLMQDWQRCQGRFAPQSPRQGKWYRIDSEKTLTDAARAVKEAKHRIICVNDDGYEDFGRMKAVLQEAFGRLLPTRSAYEKT